MQITKTCKGCEGIYLDINVAKCTKCGSEDFTPNYYTTYEELEARNAELEGLLSKHRQDAYITCDENCFCWDVEKFVIEQDRQLTPLAVNTLSEPACCASLASNANRWAAAPLGKVI